MSRHVLTIMNDGDRERACAWVRKAPPGTSLTFKVNKRTLDQNALLWSLLGDVSRQVDWYGRKLSSDDWKDVFTASLRRARVVPGIDPGTYVPLGMRTSDMTKDECSQLIELILAFGAEHGVRFSASDAEIAA